MSFTSRVRLAIAVVVLSAISIYLAVYGRGWLHAVPLNLPPTEILYNIENSPADESQKVQEDIQRGRLEDCYLVFYRADCSDCHDLYRSVVSGATTSDRPIHWIASRTDAGARLKEKARESGIEITEVPTVLSYTSGELSLAQL